MEIEEFVQRRAAAGREFDLHEDRSDGLEVSGSLAGGLTILRDSLYKRVHEDVQSQHGMDSILAPISEEKSERLAKIEIELFQIAVSAAVARDGDYVDGPDDWYWQWPMRLRLGILKPDTKITKRVHYYLAKSADRGRLAFIDIITRALPEARRAPLVLFRLLPSAIEVATSLAFGDRLRAAEAREHQAVNLPAIGDCHRCRGKLLENGEQCRECGNPLWLFDWLTSLD